MIHSLVAFFVAGLNTGVDRDEYPGASRPESEGHRLQALVRVPRQRPPASLPLNAAKAAVSTWARALR